VKKTFMLAVAMLATVAHAEFISGNELLRRLESSESYDRGLGMGYVAGVFDATSGLHHCSPSSVSLGQMRDMTLKALRAMPEMRDRSADLYVVVSAKRMWPCKKKNSNSDISPDQNL
jgi:hypothetical protein